MKNRGRKGTRWWYETYVNALLRSYHFFFVKNNFSFIIDDWNLRLRYHVSDAFGQIINSRPWELSRHVALHQNTTSLHPITSFWGNGQNWNCWLAGKNSGKETPKAHLKGIEPSLFCMSLLHRQLCGLLHPILLRSFISTSTHCPGCIFSPHRNFVFVSSSSENWKECEKTRSSRS